MKIADIQSSIIRLLKLNGMNGILPMSSANKAKNKVLSTLSKIGLTKNYNISIDLYILHMPRGIYCDTNKTIIKISLKSTSNTIHKG